MLVPPVVMMISACSLPRFNAAVVSAIVSPMMPRSRVSKCRCLSMEMSDGRFESTMEEKEADECFGDEVS